MLKLSDPNWQKLFDDLVVLVRQNQGHLSRKVKNEEDFTCNAIGNCGRGVDQEQFQLPKDDSFYIWPLLAIIATRKSADLAAYLKAKKKRDISRATERKN